MDGKDKYLLNIWTKYKKESFPKNIECLIDIAKRNPSEYGEEKENILKEIRSNLNIVKLEKDLLRKAKFIEEESLKIKENDKKKMLLKSALDIYYCSKRFLDYLKQRSTTDSSKSFIDSYITFVDSKIKILEERCKLSLHQNKLGEQRNHSINRKRSLGDILKDINSILDPYKKENSAESIYLRTSVENNCELNSKLLLKLKTLLENTKKLNVYNDVLKRIQEKSIISEKIINEKLC